MLVPALGLHKAVPINSHLWTGERFTGPFSLLNHWLLGGFEQEDCLHYVPNGETTMLQWITPNLLSHRWPQFNSPCNETKPKDTGEGKNLWKGWEMEGVEEREEMLENENNPKALYKYMGLPKNKCNQ